jgi:hypothetical protein
LSECAAGAEGLDLVLGGARPKPDVVGDGFVVARHGAQLVGRLGMGICVLR